MKKAINFSPQTSFVSLSRYTVLLSLTLILLTACSPQKRLNRLLDNHPELVFKDSTRIDTVLSTVLPPIRVDSTWSFSFDDTLKIVEQYFYAEIIPTKDLQGNNQLKVNAGCDSVTVYIPFSQWVYFPRVMYHKEAPFLKKVMFSVSWIVLFVWIGKELIRRVSPRS